MTNKTHITRLTLAAVAANIVGFFAMTGLPFFFEATQEFRNLSPHDTGFIYTVVLSSTALTSLCISPFMDRLSCRKVAFSGALFASVCYSICPYLSNHVFVWGCIAGGIGSGCSLGAAHSAIARVKNAEQNYAYLLLGTSIVTAVLVGGLKYFLVLADNRVGVVAAWLCFPLAFIVLLMPKDKTDSSQKVQEAPKPTIPLLLAALAILVLMFKSLGGKVLWTNTEYLANLAGFTDATIAPVLGITGLGGMVGSIFAIGLKDKIGRTAPLFWGLLFTILMISVMQFSGNKAGFFIGRLGWVIGGSFILPYIFGTMAALDPLGRINAAASGLGTISGAFGPFIAGIFRQSENGEFYRSTFVLVCFIFATICGLIVTMYVDKRERASTPIVGHL